MPTIINEMPVHFLCTDDRGGYRLEGFPGTYGSANEIKWAVEAVQTLKALRFPDREMRKAYDYLPFMRQQAAK